MGNIVVLFAGFSLDSARNNFCLEKQFGGKSSAELALKWASSNGTKTFVLSVPENSEKLSSVVAGISPSSSSEIEIIEEDSWTASKIALKIAECCKKSECDSALYSWIDTPFLNNSITKKLLGMHAEYIAEYTFADGFPYGVAPEVINAGTASIIANLAGEDASATRTALFDVMKREINSFEIETLVSDFDYRPLRIFLESSSKGGLVSCSALFSSLNLNENDIAEFDADELCSVASKNPLVIRNIPHFFDIQITSKVNHKTLYSPENANIGIENLPDMSVCEFEKLAEKISEFSPGAVVSLSAFGEATKHPDFLEFVGILSKKGLRILVETDGLCVDSEFVSSVAGKISGSEIDWIVDIDAADSSVYAKVRNAPESDFQKAVDAVSALSVAFKNHVYPQLTRMNENEENLEKFFRFWRNAESPSNGKIIIKKYDSLCSALPDRKPADLSPLRRVPCWHLSRDFVILSDGSVPKCRSCGKSQILGNAFAESLSDIWDSASPVYAEHVSGNYREKCGGCDEFYTFSF